MSQKSRSPARHLVHRQGTVENLVAQGFHALESSPSSPYQNDWHQLLDRLELLTLSAYPSNKPVNESSSADASFPLEAVTEENVPRRYVWTQFSSLD